MKTENLHPIRSRVHQVIAATVVVVLLSLPGTGRTEELFSITATGGGITRSVSGSSVVALVNNAINAKDTFSVFQGNAFTADLNYAGVPGAITFTANAAGTSATLNIPSANFSKTFNGTSRTETEQQLEDFLKTDATGVITTFYKAVNAKSLVAVSDGNPRSATAMAASGQYLLYGAMVARTNEERERQKDLGGISGFGAVFSYGSFTANGIHGSTYSLPLSVPFRFSQHVGLNLEFPLSYQKIGSAKVFGGGIVAGVPVQLMRASESRVWSWQVTPFGGVTGSASKEMAAGGLLSIAGVASVIARDFRRGTISMGNVVSSHSGIPLSVAEYRFDPGVKQTILKNGGKVDFPIGRRWILDGSFVHSNFTGDAALKHYETVGGEVVYRALGKPDSERYKSRYLRVGISSDLGSNYHSTQFQVGASWKF